MLRHRTKDMRFAAYLWMVQGVRFLGLEEIGESNRRNRPDYLFVFEISESVDLDKVTTEFYNAEAQVEPRKYLSLMDTLRERMKDKPYA